MKPASTPLSSSICNRSGLKSPPATSMLPKSGAPASICNAPRLLSSGAIDAVGAVSVVIDHGVDLAEVVGRPDHDRLTHGHQHAFEAFIESRGIGEARRRRQQAALAADQRCRDRRTCAEHVDHAAGSRGRRDLRRGEGARRRAIRRELTGDAGDADELTDRKTWRWSRIGEDEDRVRCRRIAVTVRVLDIEAAAAVGVDCGDHAECGHRLAAEGRGVAGALDGRDGRDRRIDRGGVADFVCGDHQRHAHRAVRRADADHRLRCVVGGNRRRTPRTAPAAHS